MSELVTIATDASYTAELLDAKGVVLVDFWAEWCGPCKMLMPAVEEIAKLYAGEVKVAKINADDNKAAAAKFEIRGLPTLLVLQDGVEKERILGVISKSRIAAALDKVLGN
ncbi:thioredoxin [Ideonella sp. B508-1]|uniref:thioredoxin n=1 Tax=Ideonella sp. B508-1 TaxID=137716 RepID=UPI000344EADE|nr:thioredoxin [Ideonella sp. B508-1]